MVCLSTTYPFKFFKGCLPQNLLTPLDNTLFQLECQAQLKVDLDQHQVGLHQLIRKTTNGYQVGLTGNFCFFKKTSYHLLSF